MPDRRTESLDRPRTAVLLALLLVPGCAPGRVAGPPPASPGSVQPAPTPAPAPIATPAPSPERIEFAQQVRPLLEEKCAPCHFPGGRMYERLPFDREETIRTLGAAMFTRLRDPVDQELLRIFLGQTKDQAAPLPAH